MLLYRSVCSWIRHLLACMGGCLGCCTKPASITAADERSKFLKTQGLTVRKPSISEDFWSTSTCEMDNSGAQYQRSISSMSTSAQSLDRHGAGSTSSPSEFVNHGRLLWMQIRQQWIGNKKPETQAEQLREPRLRGWLPLALKQKMTVLIGVNLWGGIAFTNYCLYWLAMLFPQHAGTQLTIVCWRRTSRFLSLSLLLKW